MGSLTPHSFPRSPKHCNTLKMAWSSHPVQALPSSLSAKEIPIPSCLVLNRPVWGGKVSRGGRLVPRPRGPVQLSSLTRPRSFRHWPWSGTPQVATVGQEGHSSSGQSESPPPTRRHFLVEQAQVLAQRCAPSWNPQPRDPGALLEGQGEEWALHLERD